MASEMFIRVRNAMIDAQESTKDRFLWFEVMARAAIEAMREPSADMIEAARRPSGVLIDKSSREGGPVWSELPPGQIADVFRSMIGAVLKD